MILNKQNKNLWQGFVLIYTFTWLVIFMSSISNQHLDRIQEGEVFNPFFWSAIYAGGVGSILGSLNSLFQRCIIQRNFQPQFTIYYLVQPIFGMAEGIIVYIVFGVGILFVNLYLNGQTVASSTIVVVLLTLSVIAGQRQYPIVWIRKLVRLWLTNMGYQ